MVLEQNPKQRSAKNTSSSFEFSSMKRTLIPYLDSLMLLIMTISIIVTRYCPFIQGRYAHMAKSSYLGVMVAIQTLQRLLGLFKSFEAPTFEFKKKNFHRIGKILSFLIAAASSFYGLTMLSTDNSIGNLLKSLSMTVFPYMVHDSLTGTKQFDQTSNLMSALLFLSGLVLEKFGYKVTGVAAVLSMLIKGVYGMLGSKNVSKPNLFNALLAVVSVVCLAVAVKYKVVFNLPNLADLFSTASTSTNQ